MHLYIFLLIRDLSYNWAKNIMTNDNFSSAYKILNPAQKKAVDTIEGPVMVVAGPGTGKTQILTLRIANILLKTQINPENILALTFTESAVLSMRRRLVDIIGTPGYRVEINTFHGFCNDIIKSNPNEFEEFLSSSSITEIEQIQILEDIIKNLKLEFLKPFTETFFYLRPVMSAINELKKEGITPTVFKEALEYQQADFEKITDLYHEKGAYKGIMKGKYADLQKQISKNLELVKIYEEYQKKLRAQKLYDFNDMLLEAVVKLQKDKNLLLKLQENYHYILVDEHQDTNASQNKLIELLSGFFENPNLFVVGDEKQAIFRFQGASLENFLYFKKLYPKATLINLEENYRSQQTILDASGSLISKNVSANLLEQALNLKSQNTHPKQKIQLAELSDYFAELHFIAKSIQEKIKSGTPAREIAVLGRNNKDLLEISQVLGQYQIPYVVESDQNIFADPDIRKLIMILRAVGSFGNDLSLVPVLHIDFFNITPLDIYKLISFSSKNKISLYELLVDKDKLSEIKLESPKKIVDLVEKLKNWKTQSINENIAKLFINVVDGSGFKSAILAKPNSLEILDKVIGLYEEIKLQVDKNPLYSLEDFLKYLNLLQEHDLLIKKPVKTILKNAVRLMTSHKSKGLEFDWVYIINAYMDHWGGSKKRPQYLKIPWEYLGVKLQVDFDAIEDERRLFYVSLTRARKGVMISYSTLGLDAKAQIPTQFLEEISYEYIEQIDVSKFEQEFLSQKEIILSPHIAQSPDIKNKEFIKELFYERGLSATALNDYLKCPWRYFYKDLLQLPEAKVSNMLYGSAIHQALNLFIKTLKTSQPDESFLIETFKKSLLKLMGESDEENKFEQRGEKALKVYFQQKASKWKNNLLGEMKINGVKLGENITLNGRIDMIEPIANSKEVIVYDFKTGKGKSKDALEDYKRQLTFYKLLLEKYHLGKYEMKEGVIDFVEADEKGKLHQENFVIEVSDVKELDEQIKFIADQIITLKFWDSHCDDKSCEYCKLREMVSPLLK